MRHRASPQSRCTLPCATSYARRPGLAPCAVARAYKKEGNYRAPIENTECDCHRSCMRSPPTLPKPLNILDFQTTLPPSPTLLTYCPRHGSLGFIKKSFSAAWLAGQPRVPSFDIANDPPPVRHTCRYCTCRGGQERPVLYKSRRKCPLCGGQTYYRPTFMGWLTGYSRRICASCSYVDPLKVKLYREVECKLDDK